jgi:zinc protease
MKMEVIEQAIDAVLKDCATTVAKPADVERAKTQLVAGAVYQRDNQLDLASAYGQALAIGLTVDDVREWPSRIRAVTGDQIRDAAARDVIKREAVTGFLLPGKVP